MRNPPPMKKDDAAWGLWFCLGFVLVALFILGICGAIALWRVDSLKNDLQDTTYQVYMVGSKVWESVGDTDGLGKGFIQFTASQNQMNYLFDIADIGTPTHIAIYGPTTSNNPKTASQYLPSDGSSLSLTVVNGGNNFINLFKFTFICRSDFWIFDDYKKSIKRSYFKSLFVLY